jgi:hypothetical protein
VVSPSATIDWASPLESENCCEYRERAALRKTGIEALPGAVAVGLGGARCRFGDIACCRIREGPPADPHRASGLIFSTIDPFADQQHDAT